MVNVPVPNSVLFSALRNSTLVTVLLSEAPASRRTALPFTDALLEGISIVVVGAVLSTFTVIGVEKPWLAAASIARARIV